MSATPPAAAPAAATPVAAPAAAKPASPAKTAPPRASAASLAAVATRQPARPATPPVAAPAPAPVEIPVAAKAAPESPWAKLFQDWPSDIPRRGVVVTKLNEPNPFKGFMMLREDFVLLERISPDSLGGRFLLLPFDEIYCVKFTDPLKEDQLQKSGFEGRLSS